MPLLRFRHRSRTSGSNQRSASREWRGRSHCLLVASGSPALPVTPASTTMTRPPARRALLGPTPMGWNVPEFWFNYCRNNTWFIFSSLLEVICFCLCNFCSTCSVQAVPGRHRAHAGLRVQMVECSSCKHEDFLFQCGQHEVWQHEWWVFLFMSLLLPCIVLFAFWS